MGFDTFSSIQYYYYSCLCNMQLKTYASVFFSQLHMHLDDSLFSEAQNCVTIKRFIVSMPSLRGGSAVGCL